VQKKMKLHRETLRALATDGGELGQAKGAVSATCQIPSICEACPTHVGYHTCYRC
jgi:hypothetical protein